MAEHDCIVDLEAFAAAIPDGATIAVPADYAGVSMVAARALIRRGARRLHLVCVPTSGLFVDLMIGAGCVDTLQAAAVTFGEFGPAPRFTKAFRDGAIRMLDATCPAIHAGLQAAEKGVPFMPLRGIIGSDLLKVRDDWKVIDNPFAADDPIVVLPAIRPDVALFHAPLADRHGNVWVGDRGELQTMAHAAVTTFATVERVDDTNLLDDPKLISGVIQALYVGAVALAPGGAWPVGFWAGEAIDADHMRLYMRMAVSDDGFAEYLERFVFDRQAAA